ncbi:ribosome maturation factor RimP [Alicyclobacillus tolerans]|uniref:Ribosome maturation factor RimP n=1 Tax=Alicyclobacillus tolerans TaxID=90970 RepID=A0ABT9LX93_9BACL|nr:ribosome maturation factor RimP [Alicyclobacillus tengchongensis]MDP9728882.1 ribosome maturation factor RimP [Alicyclobacillus tengchongensis]
MANERVTDIVERLALPIVEQAGVELVEVEYRKEGSNWYLRVYIDKEGGVDIDDCSHVSEQLSDELDRVDPIPNSYFLEVSSPGAERPLKKPADFYKAVGERVHIRLYEPLLGQKTFDGTLLSYNEQELEVEYMDKTAAKRVILPVSKVASARLSVWL